MKNYKLKNINFSEKTISFYFYKLKDLYYYNTSDYEKKIIVDIIKRLNKRIYNFLKEINKKNEEC